MEDVNTIETQLKEEYDKLSDEAKQLIGKVLSIEKEKLHMLKPHGVTEEILNAIDSIVR